MEPTQHDEQVPSGKVRRIGLTMQAACALCRTTHTFHSTGAGDAPKRLRAAGWSTKRGAWHCPSCTGKQPKTDGLRLVQ